MYRGGREGVYVQNSSICNLLDVQATAVTPRAEAIHLPVRLHITTVTVTIRTHVMPPPADPCVCPLTAAELGSAWIQNVTASITVLVLPTVDTFRAHLVLQSVQIKCVHAMILVSGSYFKTRSLIYKIFKHRNRQWSKYIKKTWWLKTLMN